jgi:hypothetical protein
VADSLIQGAVKSSVQKNTRQAEGLQRLGKLGPLGWGEMRKGTVVLNEGFRRAQHYDAVRGPTPTFFSEKQMKFPGNRRRMVKKSAGRISDAGGPPKPVLAGASCPRTIDIERLKAAAR